MTDNESTPKGTPTSGHRGTRVRHTNVELAMRDKILVLARRNAAELLRSAGAQPDSRSYPWLTEWYRLCVLNAANRVIDMDEARAFAHGVAAGLRDHYLVQDMPTDKEIAWRTHESHPRRVTRWFGQHGTIPLEALCVLSLWYQVPVHTLLSEYGAPAAQRWREQHSKERSQRTLRPVVIFPEDAPQNLVAAAAGVAQGTPDQPLPHS